MGKIKVPGRLSGREYTINIKGDTPSATEQARIRQYLDQKETEFAAQYESTFGRPLQVDDGTALGRGWERGKADAYSRLGTATEYLGSGLGIDAIRNFGQGMRQSGDYESFLESLRQPAPTELSDVDSIGSALTWAGEQAGQTLPESAASLGATIGGFLVGTAATGNPVTGGAIGVGTGALTIAPTTFGGNIQRQEAEVAAGRRQSVDVGTALAATVGQSLLESISDKLLLTGLAKPGMKIFTRTIAGAAEGAATEGLTEVGQQVLERWQAGLPLDDEQAIQEYAASLAAGAVIGAPVRGTTAALGIGLEEGTPKPEPKPKEETPPAAAQPPAIGTVEAPEEVDTTEPITPPLATAEAQSKAVQDAVEEVTGDAAPVTEPTPQAAEQGISAVPTTSAEPEVDTTEDDEDFEVIEDFQPQPTKAPKAQTVATAPTVETSRATPELVARAKQQVEWSGQASVPHLVDYLEVDEPTALDLLGALEAAGVVSAEDVNGKRTVRSPAPEPTAPAAQKPAPRLQPFEGQVLEDETPPPAPAAPEPLSEADAFELATQPAAAFAEPEAPAQAELDLSAWSTAPTEEEFMAMRDEVPPPAAEPVAEPVVEPAVEAAPETPNLADPQGLFDQLVSGERQSVTPDEAFAFPDELLANEPQPNLKDVKDAGARSSAMRNWIARQDARRKIAGAKKVAQSERRGAELRAANPPKATGALGQVGPSDATLTASGLLTPTDPTTLQPTGPARLGPETFTLRRKRRRLTGKITQAWLEFLESTAAQAAQTNNAALGAITAAKIKQWFGTAAPEAYRRFRGYIDGIDAVETEDVTTHTDKEAVYALLRTRINTFKSTQMEGAFQFFSRFPNPTEALREIGAILGLAESGTDANSWNVSKKSKTYEADLADREDGIARAKITGSYAFYSGLNQNTARLAAAWVEKNLSPASQFALVKARNDAKVATEEAVEASAVVSAANDAIVEELSTGEAMMAAAAGIETADNAAYRKKLERQAQAAAREVRVAAPTDTSLAMPVSAPLPNTSLVKYRKGETRIDAILRLLRDQGVITEYSNATQVLVALADFEAGEKAARDFIYGPVLKMADYAVDAMGVPLQPSVMQLLRSGNLVEALQGIGLTHPNPVVASVALKLSTVVGNTKVRVVDDLRDASGIARPGLFDPTTNEILLDSKTGMNAHVVLHEMAHAALSHTLADPASRVTQEVQAIFDAVKDMLGTHYGSTSLQEFAAEALTNRAFRGELSRLYPNGDAISAWTRFSDAVLNFLRTLVGKPRTARTTALSALDAVLTAAISPAPNERGAGALYMASTAAGVADSMRLINKLSNILKTTTPGTLQSTADQVLEFLRGVVGRVVSSLFVQSQNLPMLTEVLVKARLPEAREVERSINAMHGAVTRKLEALTGTSKVLEEIRASVSPAEYEQFEDMMNTGSMAGVNASKPVGHYVNNPDKHMVHQQVNAMYRQLPQKLRDAAKTIWGTYERQYKALYYALTDAMQSLAPGGISTGPTTTLLARMLAQIDMMDGYIPFVREGDYWLKFVARATPNSPPEPVYLTFPTQAERTRAIAALKTMPEVERNANGDPEFDTSLRLDPRIIRGSPDGTFVKDIMTVLDQNNVDQAVKEQFLKLVVDLLPETSFAKSLHRREGFPGFITDPVEAFNIKAYSIARQTERLRYSRRVRAAVNEMNEAWNRTKDSATHGTVEELKQRASFALNPPRDQIAEAVTRATFTFTLSANVSSALVQTASIPIIIAPNLAARYKTAPTFRAISMATKFFASSGLTRVQGTSDDIGVQSETKVRAAPSIDNWFVVKERPDPADPTSGATVVDYSVRTDQNLTPEQITELEALIPLVKEMASQGELSRSLYYDSFGFETAGRKKSLWTRVTTLAGGAFHIAERMNRQVTALASYQLHYAKLKALRPTEPDAVLREEAAAEAVRLTRKLNGGTSLNDTPRLTQQGWGRVLGMFRTYGMHIAHMQLKYMKEAAGIEVRAFKRKLASGEIPTNPQTLAQLAQLEADAKIAFRSTLGMWGSSLFFAGVAGVPMFNAVAMLVNALFLDDDEDDFETIVRKHIGEGMYKGWLTAGTGMDVSGRIGLSGLLLRADRFNSNPSEADTFMHVFGGPAWATGTRFVRGAKEVLSGGDMQRGIEQMLPAGIANGLKSIRYASEGMTTRRGDPVVDDVSTGELIGQFFGFTPASYTLNQERNQVLKRIDTATNTKRTKAMKAYYLAQTYGDAEDKAAARAAIREYNARHPSNPIEPSDLKKSFRQHQKTTQQMYNGVVITASNRAAIMQNARDWDQGWQLF